MTSFTETLESAGRVVPSLDELSLSPDPLIRE